VILRILALESPNSELRLKIYGRKKFIGQKLEFGKLQGIFVKIQCLEGIGVKR
jgi:hypothetical protein